MTDAAQSRTQVHSATSAGVVVTLGLPGYDEGLVNTNSCRPPSQRPPHSSGQFGAVLLPATRSLNLSYGALCRQQVDVLASLLTFCCAVRADAQVIRMTPDAAPGEDTASYSLAANTADHLTGHLLHNITARTHGIKQIRGTIAQH